MNPHTQPPLQAHHPAGRAHRLTPHREDAATAEVSRSQLWQWVRHGVMTAEGKRVDKAYALRLLREQADGLAAKAPKGNKFDLAARYFSTQVTGEDYADFLTRCVKESPPSPPLGAPGAFRRFLAHEGRPSCTEKPLTMSSPQPLVQRNHHRRHAHCGVEAVDCGMT
jgi:hypothetical protein